MYGATLLCEATGELAGPAAQPCISPAALPGQARGFLTYDGHRIGIEACCTIDSFEQLITTLPRAATAIDTPPS